MPKRAKVLPSLPHFTYSPQFLSTFLEGKMHYYPQTAGQQWMNFMANEIGLGKATKHAFSKNVYASV
jgi:hypothetical protein